MNRDQRQIIAALESLGWHRIAAGSFPEMMMGANVARLLGCGRVVEALRITDRQRPESWTTARRIEYVHPLYGRDWSGRMARIVHALATSKRSPRELGILLHALGGGGRSRDPLGWRNVYAAGEGDDLVACESLAGAGLMTSTGTKAWHAGGDERLTMFKVTTLGAAEVGVALGD